MINHGHARGHSSDCPITQRGACMRVSNTQTRKMRENRRWEVGETGVPSGDISSVNETSLGHTII